MQPWSVAMHEALYGRQGFYRRENPDAHFRTSVSASPLLATTMASLVVAVDEALDHPDHLDIVDVGAGDGSLLAGVLEALPEEVSVRARPTAVELRARPTDLPLMCRWRDTVPEDIVGLLVAHEYLDNVPVDVMTCGAGLHQVLVDPVTGTEGQGPPSTTGQAEWLAAWWPLTVPGTRAEIGSSRDDVWADLVAKVDRGLALAVDYGHQRAQPEGFPLGTLTGYRDGRQVAAVPDGSCDITAHVAMDACREAGRRAGAEASALLHQREALRVLGLEARRPPIELARSDPQGYVRELARASHASELLDPESLGSFWWLLQAKGCRPDISGVRWD